MNHSFACFTVLAMMSVAYLGSVGRMERLRLVVSNRQVSSMLGTFTFAGTMLLPGELLLPLVAVVYYAAWPTFRRAKWPLHRHTFNALAVATSCLVAASVIHALPAGIGIAAGIAAFMLVNSALVAVMMLAANHRGPLKEMMCNPRTHWVVLSTQACGSLVGLFMQWHASLGVIGVPVLAAIHSDALLGTLRDTRAVIDGVYNRPAWLVMADEATRRREWVSVLVVETTIAAQAAALAVIRGHARPEGASNGPLSPRLADVIGAYSPTHIVVLRHLCNLPAAQRAARRLSADLLEAGVDAGVGTADSKLGGIPEALAVASAEAAIRRAAAIPDGQPR